MIAFQLKLNRNRSFSNQFIIYMSFEVSQGLNNECSCLVAVIKKRENYVVRILILCTLCQKSS